MRLTELEDIIESRNKFYKFIESDERVCIRFERERFINVDKFLEYFNEKYIFLIDLDTELYYEDGYIKFEAKGKEKSWNGKEIIYSNISEVFTLCLEVYVSNEWE